MFWSFELSGFRLGKRVDFFIFIGPPQLLRAVDEVRDAKTQAGKREKYEMERQDL